MKNKHVFFGILLSIAAVSYTFNNVPLKDLINDLGSLNYKYIAPSVAFLALSYLFRAIRWKYIVRSIKEVSALNLLSPLMIGFMGNLLPARVGEIIRAYLLGQNEGVSFSASLASIIVERIFDLFILLIMVLTIFLAAGNLLEQGNISLNSSNMQLFNKFTYTCVITFFVITTLFVMLIHKRDLLIKSVQFLAMPFPVRLRERLTGIVITFSEGINILRSIKELVIITLLSFIIWACIFMMFYIFYYVFNIGSLPLISAIVLLVAISVTITLMPTPGNIGSFQAGCVISLHEFFNIPKVTAVNYGIATWLTATIFITISGLYYIFKANYSFSELTKFRRP